MSVTPSTPLVGCTLGHYRFLSLIGEGGTGQVYLARDEHLHRDVAVKVLSPGLFGDEQARHRFRSEALTLSQLNHPNIATIHDFETVGDRDLLVMEYVAGETMSERIARKPLAEEEIAKLGTQLAQGLAAAHSNGIIHRDLKPSNLRITPDGFLKILDYGLARLAPTRLTDLSTRTGIVAESVFEGTPAYMAPEQLRGRLPTNGQTFTLWERSSTRWRRVAAPTLAAICLSSSMRWFTLRLYRREPSTRASLPISNASFSSCLTDHPSCDTSGRKILQWTCGASAEGRR